MTARRLRSGLRLRSDESVVYEVDRLLGQGGFGTTYTGHRLSSSGRPSVPVCIKVCTSRHDWHGEAFFGRLLDRNPRVVRLIDAFVAATGAGAAQKRRHVLVFELMDGGTVWDWLDEPRPWSEARVRREIKALLQVLATLHYSGVTHRDLKPDNVYLRNGHLTLGDFGITKMRLDPAHSFASAFAPGFAPMNVLRNQRWAEADDVYQVGLLTATLLTGQLWWTGEVSVKGISCLPASDELKSWVWHATGEKARRYWDAGEALDALDSLKRIHLSPGRAPRALAGCSVVFTGRIDGLTRAEAFARTRQAGARPLQSMTDSVDLLVAGRLNAGAVGSSEGLKLFSARERIRQGQDIRIISGKQFKRLAGVKA